MTEMYLLFLIRNNRFSIIKFDFHKYEEISIWF